MGPATASALCQLWQPTWNTISEPRPKPSPNRHRVLRPRTRSKLATSDPDQGGEGPAQWNKLGISPEHSMELAMKAVGQARLELSGMSTPDHLRPPPLHPADAHTSAHKSVLEPANPRMDLECASGCPWSTARATSPSLGRPTPGVVKQDKSSRGSVDTTKTRSDPKVREQWREANRHRQRQIT